MYFTSGHSPSAMYKYIQHYVLNIILSPEKQDFQGSNHSQNINKRKNKYLSIKMCNSLSSSFTNVMVADIRMQFKGRKTIPIILLVSNTQINQAHYRLRPVRNGNEI